MVGAAPIYLEDRVAQGEPLPAVRWTWAHKQEKETQQATMAYVLGLGGGMEGEGMPREVFVELVDWIMPPR